MANRPIRNAFVSTNSICRAEQVRSSGRSCSTGTGWKSLSSTAPSHGEARRAPRAMSMPPSSGWRTAAMNRRKRGCFPIPIKCDPVESRHGALTAYLFDARRVENRPQMVKEEGRPINRAGKVAIGSKAVSIGLRPRQTTCPTPPPSVMLRRCPARIAADEPCAAPSVLHAKPPPPGGFRAFGPVLPKEQGQAARMCFINQIRPGLRNCHGRRPSRLSNGRRAPGPARRRAGRVGMVLATACLIAEHCPALEL
jgi:hypothetical protein